MLKTEKKRIKRDRDVPFHAWGCELDVVLAFGKRSSAVGGSQGAADGAALPLGLGMAPAHSG